VPPPSRSPRRLLIDLRPLRRSADFRRLFASSVVSSVGGQMTSFAVALQVYRLTGSSAAVGGVGLAAAVPSVVVGLFGGPLIDSVDRRRLVLATTGCLSVVSAVLAAQAFAGLRSVELLYALVFLQYLFSSVNGPARRTFAPRLLDRDLLPAGAALQMLAMHASLVLGPPLAGLVTALAGLPVCYLVDAVSFLASLYAVFRLPPMRPGEGGTGRGARAVLDGLRFVAGLVWGAALVGVGLVGGVVPTFGCLVVAGVADVLGVVFRTALVQTATSARPSSWWASGRRSSATSAAAWWDR
jgi:MFS family permease